MNSAVHGLVRSLPCVYVVGVDGGDTELASPTRDTTLVLYSEGEWVDEVDRYGRVVDFEDDTEDVEAFVRRWARC